MTTNKTKIGICGVHGSASISNTMNENAMKEGEPFFLFDRWYTYHKSEELASLKVGNKPIKKGDTVTVFLPDKTVTGEVRKVFKRPVENERTAYMVTYMVRVCVSATRYIDLPLDRIEYRNWGDKGFYEIQY